MFLQCEFLFEKNLHILFYFVVVFLISSFILRLSPLNKLNDFVKEVGKLIDFDESLNNVVEQLDLLVDLFIYDEHREIASTVKVCFYLFLIIIVVSVI